jgi:hypothetical protein
MQQSVGRTALCAIPANLEPAHEDVKLAFALDLTFEPVEQIALKFSNLSASQARHMNVVALWPALIKVLLALHVHQVKLINEPVSL